jgi:periplasmic copper chaperone A
MFPGRVFATAFAVLAAVTVVSAEDHDDHHVSELNGVRAVHAWTRATGGNIALVFVDIENGSDAIVLIEGGHSEIAGTVELVGFRLKDGNPAYEPVGSVPVGPGKEMQLAPERLALRLTGLTQPLAEGGEFELEIVFDIGEIDVHVAVEAVDATQHSHAGHNH